MVRRRLCENAKLSLLRRKGKRLSLNDEGVPGLARQVRFEERLCRPHRSQSERGEASGGKSANGIITPNLLLFTDYVNLGWPE